MERSPAVGTGFVCALLFVALAMASGGCADDHFNRDEQHIGDGLDLASDAETDVLADGGAGATDAGNDVPSSPGTFIDPPPVDAIIGTGPVSSLAEFERDYAAVNDGLWFANEHNEAGYLAWGESYVMTSLVHLFERTNDLRWLDRLVLHADGVLAQRDSARGMKDYRNLSLPCWRSTSYTSKPVCFAVHTGLIAYPLAQLGVIVKRSPALAAHVTYDGTTLGDKAALYIQEAEAAAQVHDDEWRDAGADKGTYVFRPDMSFYSFAGKAAPYNQMNGLGLLHLALADATDKPVHRERARRLANTLLGGMKLDVPNNAYFWNYWDPVTPSPEDVSHAAINALFVWRAAKSQVVFEATHLDRVEQTFMRRIYVDTKTSNDQLSANGGQNQAAQRAQVGRWAILDSPRVHAATRDALPAFPTARSGSILMGRALLFDDLLIRPWTLEPVASNGGTGTGAAFASALAIDPPAADRPCLAKIRYKASTRVNVEQIDASGHRVIVAILAPTATHAVAHLPFDPKLGVIPKLHFAGAGAASLEIAPADPALAPAITSAAPSSATAGAALVYQAAAQTDSITRWSVLRGPATVEAWTGKVTITPATQGVTRIELEARNDHGATIQAFDVVSAGP